MDEGRKNLIVEKRQIEYSEKASSSPIVIDVLSSSKQAEAACRWQDLEQCTNNTGLTNSWIWVKTWLDYHAPLIEYSFIFGQHNGQIIGAALVVEALYKRRGIPVARIHLGTGKYVEYNRLLVVPEYLDSFAVELVKTVQHQFCWSELHLDGFVSEDAKALLKAGRNAGLLFRQVDVRKSPIFEFQKASDDGHQDVLPALGKNTRANLRRSSRLFEDTFGPVTVEWAETAEQARAILKELIDLHQIRWTRMKDQTGAFDKEHLKAYFAGMIDTLKLWPHGSLIICRVKAGETTLGCLYHYIEDGHIMFTKGGIAQFEDAKMKPGLIAHVACMDECWKRGLAEKWYGNKGLTKYDFLAGDEPYKDTLTNTQGRLVWATAERGLLLWLMRRISDIKNKMKDIIRKRYEAEGKN